MKLLTTDSSILLNEANPQCLLFGRTVRETNKEKQPNQPPKQNATRQNRKKTLLYVFHKTQRLDHSSAALRLCWHLGQTRPRFLPSIFVMMVEKRQLSLWTGKTQNWSCSALGHWSWDPGNSNSLFFCYTGSLSWRKSLEGSVMRSQHTNPSALGELMVQRKRSRCFVQRIHPGVWSETPRVFWPLRMCLSPQSSQSLVRNFCFTMLPKRDFFVVLKLSTCF